MTSTPNAPDGHPDLADLESLRTGEAEASVRRHVDGCPRCAAVLDELTADAATWQAALAPDPEDVPEDADRAATRAIFAEAVRIRGRARRTGLLVRIGAAAAAILVLGVALNLIGGEREDATERADVRALAPDARYDVDGSGTVDIVDAYRVARRLRRGEEAPGAWDVNDDGAVDAGDVRTLALVAVAVTGRER